MEQSDFRDHLDRLKESLTGPEIAADLGLDHRGKRFFCPECQPAGGKTPDLSIFDQGFKCFKCGLTGDIIDLVMLAGRMSMAEAVLYLEKKTGIERQNKPYKDKRHAEIVQYRPSWKGKSNLPAADKPKPGKIELYKAFLKKVCLPVMNTPGAAYLEDRGIKADVADLYGVRYCPDLAGLWNLASREEIKSAGLASLYTFQKAALPFLAFPYMSQGQPVFIKTRCLLSKKEADGLKIPRFLNTGGKVPFLWNHDSIRQADQVLICEGEIDALSAIMAGFVGIGLPGWSHWKDAWLKDFRGKDVIMVLDADPAGQKGTADISKRFMKAGLPCPRQLVLDEGKDLNEVIQEFMKA